MLFDVMDLLALFGVCAGSIFLTQSALFCAIYSKATDTSGFRINICLGDKCSLPGQFTEASMHRMQKHYSPKVYDGSILFDSYPFGVL